MPAQPAYDHAKIAEAVDLLLRIDRLAEQPELMAGLQWRIDRWRAVQYIMVVVGEVKKGKSSFINALLDCPGLSPVAERIASAVPIRIVYGPETRYTVHFQSDPEGETPPPRVVAPDEVARFATETGVGRGEDGVPQQVENSLNRLHVDHLLVEHPHELLRQGLMLVDLPGLGGVFKHHSRLVWEYLSPRRVDHVAFVLDSTDSPLDAGEVDCLRALGERKLERVMFLQTRIDAADPEKIASWRAGNLAAVSRLLGRPAEQVDYFPISNRLKLQWLQTGDRADYEDSGFADLESHIRDELIPNMKDLLAEPLLPELGAVVDDIGQHLDTLLQIFGEQSGARRQSAADEYDRKLREFEHWRRAGFAAITAQLSQDLRDARTTANDRFDDELGPAISVTAYERVDGQAKSESAVIELTPDAREACIALSLERYEEIVMDYHDAAEAACDAAVRKLDAGMPAPYVESHAPNVEGIHAIHHKKKSRLMEYASRSWSSMTIGVALGGAVGTVLGGFVGGSVAGPLGALAGAALGIYKAVSEAKERNRDAALARLKGILDQTSTQVQRRVMRAFRDTATSTERQQAALLDEGVAQTEARIKEALEAARQRVKATDLELRAQRQALDAQAGAIRDVAAALRAGANLG